MGVALWSISDPRCTHLSTRGSIYYFRHKIPLDLIAYYDGKKEVTRSLRTSDQREAEKLASEEGMRLDREFAQLRAAGRGTNGPAIDSDPPVPCLPKAIDVDYSARRYLAHLRKARNEAAAKGKIALEASWPGGGSSLPSMRTFCKAKPSRYSRLLTTRRSAMLCGR